MTDEVKGGSIPVPAVVRGFGSSLGAILSSKTSMVGAGGLALLHQADALGLPQKYVLAVVLGKMLQQAASDFGKNARKS